MTSRFHDRARWFSADCKWIGLGFAAFVVAAAGCGSSGGTPGKGSGGAGGGYGADAAGSGGSGTGGGGEDGPATGSGGNPEGTGGSGGGGAGSGGTDAGGGGTGGMMPPAGGRVDTSINAGWSFNRGDVTGAEATAYNDTAWTKTDLPHTWNAMDGQDGPTTPYYRGVGWYRRHLMVPGDLAGKRLYLQFDGANILTDVWVNGKVAGAHKGGFATFRFDVTDLLMVGADNVIAVKVNNAAGVDAANNIIAGSPTVNVPPLSADFTFFGGLYRGVHLLSTPPVAISPMDYGSPGVYVKQTNVSAGSADLAVTVKLSNAGAASANASVKVTVLDATNASALSLTANAAVPAKGNADAVASGKLMNPHRWNGRPDPYLYSVRVDLMDGAAVSDSVTVPLGLRAVALNPNTGFSLNGAYLDLHGVDKHQDHKDRGWAIADSDTDADFAIIKELGATTIRLAHYQHAQHTYDLADRAGLVIWAETPVVNKINNTPEFAANAEQQLIELIRQNYNHPSIAFWSVGNETLLRPGPSPDTLIGHLADVVATEDPTRLAAYAANGGDNNNPVNWHGTAHGFNEYQGWYGGRVADFAAWADGIHRDHPTGAVGLTEYGAGASVMQHTADPASLDDGADHTTKVHTEEYQAYYHEAYWSALAARPFIWGKFIWNLFDFASDTRTEGTLPGLNDKGLVTFDRQTKKDAFYLYKANWSTDPFVYLTSRRFTTLPRSGRTIKVYSNAAMVDVKVNGTSLGAKAAADHLFIWTNVTWATGANMVEASATSGGKTVTDTVTWTN
jgi:beta-galactosidase